MSKFKIYDGSTWCDPCAQNINILKSDDTFQLLDVENQNVNYYDGTSWTRIFCGLQCGDTLSTSGGAGAYYVKFLKSQGFNRITINFDSIGVPDCLQLLNETKTQLLKSSSYVGPSTLPTPGIYSIPEYLYNNETNTFSATGNNESFTLYNSTSYPVYNISNVYNTGDIVYYNYLVYQCVVPFSIGEIPGVSSDWLDISLDKLYLPTPNLPALYTLTYDDNTFDEKVFWIRVVGNPTSGTVWYITGITCGNVSFLE
jgi:hypothetical protein